MKRSSIKHQDTPHNEGQQSNTPPSTGRGPQNNDRAQSEINQPSREQAGSRRKQGGNRKTKNRSNPVDR